MGVISAIEVTVNCADWDRLCRNVENLARDAARVAVVHGMIACGLAWPGPVELGITLADAGEQRRLNRDYRGRDTSTNVLAFPAWDGQTPPPGAPLLLGDVVLAFETVAREAAEQEKSIPDHLRHLVVHGVLHLLGFDHMTAAEAAVMESLETSLLAKLGVSDPYRDAVAAPEPGAVRHV